MTIEELNRLRDIREEISELEARLDRILSEKIPISQDKVQMSSQDYPYIMSHANIEGIDKRAIERKKTRAAKTLRELTRRRDEAAVIEQHITEYIAGVNDPRIRRMIELKYIDGLTWAEVGARTHCDRTTAMRTVKKYLREHTD